MEIEMNPKVGQALMGCTDTDPVSNQRYSRIYDTFIAAVKADIDPMVIWNSLSSDDKMNMNWGNWHYVK